MDKKLKNTRKFDPTNIQTYPTAKTITDNTIKHKHTL